LICDEKSELITVKILANGGGTVVENLPRHTKVKGSGTPPPPPSATGDKAAKKIKKIKIVQT
jgi:hypothetical protein